MIRIGLRLPAFIVAHVPESFRSAYRAAMSTKHVRTAGDLVRFGCALKVECLSCGHALTMEGYEVAREVGLIELRRLAPRLRCSRCDTKAPRVTILSPPPPRG